MEYNKAEIAEMTLILIRRFKLEYNKAEIAEMTLKLAREIILYEQNTHPGAIHLLCNAIQQDRVYHCLKIMYIDYNERAGYSYAVRAIKIAEIILSTQND